MVKRIADIDLTTQILEETLNKLKKQKEFPSEIIQNLEQLIEKNQFSNAKELINAIKTNTEKTNEVD